MTPEQLTTLKAAILAETNAAFVEYRTNGQNTLMAEWLNKTKTPNVAAWHTQVEPVAVDEVTPWTAFDALSAGKRDSWLQLMKYTRDFGKASVRKWVTDIWGNATAGSNAETILLGAGQRNITRAESILGGSTTATSNAVSALKLDWVGPLTDIDVGNALQS